MAKARTFQELILTLQTYWADQGCLILQPYDDQMGAGTFHPATTLRALGPRPWKAAFVQPCRRPSDGRYGENPNRLQHYYQYQVILKPAPENVQDLYLGSLRAIGLDPELHDIRFVEDDWESPTLGAAGLGWEVWCDGMEITQFTYFQQVGGIECDPVCAELTYGLERLAMYVQNVESVYDLAFNEQFRYGEVFHQNEVEFSAFNFERADTDILFQHFKDAEKQCAALLEGDRKLALPAYDQCIKASHAFNLLDARGVISVTERAAYIGRVRALAQGCCQAWLDSPHGRLHAEVWLMPDLLLELFSEEIPARMQAGAARDLERLMVGALTDRGYLFEGIKAFAGPRRLTLVIAGLPAQQKDVREELKGPKTDAPQAALDGFLKKTSLTKDQLEVETTPKGDVYMAVIERKGRATPLVLAEIIPEVMAKLPWPKSMRWKPGMAVRWVRPLHSILCTFDGELVPFSFAGVSSGLHTMGHRFLSDGKIEAKRFEDYEHKLRAGHVILDAEERAAIIFEGVKQAAFVHGLEMIPDEGLLAEVSGLAEWPVVYIGSIRRPVHGCAGRDSADLDAHASEVFFRGFATIPMTGKDGQPLCIWSPTWSASDGGEGNCRGQRARAAGRGCRTPNSSGTRTTSTAWKAGSRS